MVFCLIDITFCGQEHFSHLSCFLVGRFHWNEFHKSINSYLDHIIYRFLNYDFMLAAFFLNLDIENEVSRVFYMVKAHISSIKFGYWNC